MADSWNKKEREKQKRQNKKEKEERKQERKSSAGQGSNLSSMLAYVDENGNLSSVPPDPRKKIKTDVEDIVLGVPKQRDLVAENPVRNGVITYFNISKGYGFIKDKDSQENIFVHSNNLLESVKEQNKVSFEIEKGHKGLYATNVKVVK
jgi:cold shock CspA family protein